MTRKLLQVGDQVVSDYDYLTVTQEESPFWLTATADSFGRELLSLVELAKQTYMPPSQ